MAHESALQLKSIHKNVLVLSRMKSGTWNFTMELADLSAIIHNVVVDAESKTSDGNVKIVCDLPKIAKIEVDVELITQVLATIVGNAIRFSRRGGIVKIELSERDDSFILTVADTGDGMEPASLDNLFEPFYSDDVDHQHGTHSLNLAVADQIIGGHEGRIDVDSEKGVGTTFAIHLPRNQIRGSVD